MIIYSTSEFTMIKIDISHSKHDVDHDEFFKMMMHKVPSCNPKDETLKAFCSPNDIAPGTIEYEEFLKMLTHKIFSNSKDEILKAFLLLDDVSPGSASRASLLTECYSSSGFQGFFFPM